MTARQTDDTQLYADHILEHYRTPRHFGRLTHSTISVQEHNPLCGDRITLDLLMRRGRLCDLAWSGSGCALSQASMSLLSDELLGKRVEELSRFSADAVFEFLHISVNPARVSCALLGFTAMHNALSKIYGRPRHARTVRKKN